MLYLSLVFMLAGVCTVTVAAVTTTYLALTYTEKIEYLSPGNWPRKIKTWLKIAAAGFISIIIGMVWASLAT